MVGGARGGLLWLALATLSLASPLKTQAAELETEAGAVDPWLAFALGQICSPHVRGLLGGKGGAVTGETVSAWVEQGFRVDAAPGAYIIKLSHKGEESEGGDIYLTLHNEEGRRSCMVALPSGATHEQFEAARAYYHTAGYPSSDVIREGASRFISFSRGDEREMWEFARITAIGPVVTVRVSGPDDEAD